MARSAHIFRHPALGNITGLITGKLLQFRNIPYGLIAQRFARASLVQELFPRSASDNSYDATTLPPASIQPLDSGKMDCKGNQFPEDLMDGYVEEQSEDCLRLNITMPSSTTSASSLPVLVFTHGGAYFIGSSTRPYYDPTTMCEDAIQHGYPHVFVSINYRLGALGFLHSPEVEHLMPANNGLHDQRIAFEWIHRFIEGFGGDADSITAMGQSAGGMSVSIHNLANEQNIWRRSIQFSGSLVTMPVKSPQEHQEAFLAQATKAGIQTQVKSSAEIAQDLISLPPSQVRSLAHVGLPSSSSTLLPYPTASMTTTRHRKPRSSTLDSQLISSTTYDGGISHNLLMTDPKRANHARTFTSIVHDSGLSDPHALLDLYSITPSDSDASALRKICLFESDVGFFAASLAQAQGFPGKSFLLLFDLGNPFAGLLPAGQCATHTWDVVSLLGACEDRAEIAGDKAYKSVIGDFRRRVLDYVATGREPWPAWTEEEGTAMVAERGGLRVVGREEYMGMKTRRGRVLALAQRERGGDGVDWFWNGVCRRFLMGGK